MHNSRIALLSAAIGGAFLLAPGAFANDDIKNVFEDLYGPDALVGNNGCATCHSGGVGGNDTANFYGMQLETNGLDNTDSFSRPFSLRCSAIRTAEPRFAPKISIAGPATPDGPVVEVDPNGTKSATIGFDPGQTVLGAPSDIVAFGIPSALSSNEDFSFSSGSSSVTVSLDFDPGTSQADRTRYRDEGLALQFNPENESSLGNSGGFFAAPTLASGDETCPQGDSTLKQNRVLLKVLNEGPSAASRTIPGEQRDGTISGNIFKGALDPEGDPLQVASVSDPSAGSFQKVPSGNDGSFVFTMPDTLPAEDITFTYQLGDGMGGVSEEATITFAIQPLGATNSPPEPQHDSFTTSEGVSFRGNLLANDSDPDMDALAVLETLPVEPELGTVAPILVGGEWKGEFDYTPNPEANGEDTFTYSAFDGFASTDATVSIVITPRNDGPVALAQPETTIDDGQDEPEETRVLSLDLTGEEFVSDPDDGPGQLSAIDFEIVSPESVEFNLSGSMLQIDTGQFSKLDNGESTNFTVRYFVEDSAGNRTAEPVEIPIAVVGTDNFPTVGGQYAETLAEKYDHGGFQGPDDDGSCLSCHKSEQISVDVDFRDECSRTVFNEFGFALCMDRGPTDPPLTNLAGRLANQEATFAPRLMSAPSISISPDTAVGAQIGMPLEADPGKKVDGTTSRVLDFRFYDPGPNTVSRVDATGQFTIDEEGVVRVASALESGVYVVRIVPINDAGQRTAAGSHRPNALGFYPTRLDLSPALTIVVTTDDPIAVDDDLVVRSNAPTPLNVLANDAGGDVETLEVTAAPTGGTLSQSGLDLTYTPAPNSSDDSFRYRTSGPTGDSPEATVRLTVVPEGGAVAIPDTASTIMGQPTEIAVLENDFGQRPIALSIASPAAEGKVEIAGDAFRYTPPPGFLGTVIFRYRASNAISASEADVVVNVRGGDGDFLAAGTNDPFLKPVAQALGDSCAALEDGETAKSSDQTDLVNTCNLLSLDVGGRRNIDAALRALRNEEMLAVNDVTQNFGRMTRNAVMARLDKASASGNDGFDVTNFSVNMGEHTITSSMFSDVLAYLSGVEGSKPGERSPFGLFLSGELSFADHEASGQETGFDLTSVSLITGADYAVDEDHLVGVALGFGHADTNFDLEQELDSTSYQLAIYGSAENLLTEGLKLDGVLAGGYNGYEMRRGIRFEAGGIKTDRVADGEFDGHHVNAVGRLSYDLASLVAGEDSAVTWPWPAFWEVSAFGELDYLFIETEAFTERGAGGLSLSVREQDYESLLGELGMRLGVPFETQFGPVNPYVELSANTEFLQQRPSVVSSFAAAGASAPTFEVVGEEADGFFGRIVLGADGRFMGADVKGEYGTTVGRDNIGEHRFSFGLGGPFVGNDWFAIDMGMAFGLDEKTEPSMGMNASYTLSF